MATRFFNTSLSFRNIFIAAIAVVVGIVIFVTLFIKYQGNTRVPTGPNIIVIMSDDQRFDSLSAMPITQERLGGKGVTFSNAFIPTPLCCPSRVSFLTGRYAHNTGIWRNNPPEGGFEGFKDDESTIAVLLQNAGYKTALIGKYMNGYHKSTYIPPGWDEWHALNKGNYYNYSMNENGKIVDYGIAPEDYSGTVIGKKAVNFIESMKDEIRPFFLVISPNAPHGDSGDNIDELKGMARPGPEEADSCIDQEPYRPPNFNEANVSDKPSFVKREKILTAKQIADIDKFNTSQVCTLGSLDRLIGSVLDALGERRDNTLVIFYSDNGYAYGEHRNRAKNCPYEECIRVPLIVSYPKLTPQAVSTQSLASANIDVTATIADVAGVSPSKKINGRSLLPILRNSNASIRDAVLIEVNHNKTKSKIYGMRTGQYKYIENGTGEKELYDLIQDPFELTNVAGKPEYAQIVLELSAQLTKMKVE